MTTDNHLELASEELAHCHMPYLAEEGLELTLEGFQQHVRDNVDGFRKWATPLYEIHHSDDAYALAFYLTLVENNVDIANNWEQVVADATKLAEQEADIVRLQKENNPVD